MIKTPVSLAAIFAIAAAAYTATFSVIATVDPDVALSRFSVLTEKQAYGRSIGHGEQALAIRQQEGADPESLVSLKWQLANAHREKGKKHRAIDLYRDVLASREILKSDLTERRAIKAHVAELEMATSNVPAASAIYAEFLEHAGDAAAFHSGSYHDAVQQGYIQLVRDAMSEFEESLPPVRDNEFLTGSPEDRLAGATDMTSLGGYYAARPGGEYAAAGLLSAAYATRMNVLGAEHEDTLQTALLLGPVYQKIGRTRDAEAIYLSAFHAQERSQGSNNPDLSLYIRLLAEVYKSQGRYTEAEALNTHIQRLFRDAFGSRRYVSNKVRDRRRDVNRPVSAAFPLGADFEPEDLVSAAEFGINLSKNSQLLEMFVRRAEELDADNGETMPDELSKLLRHCASKSGQKLSLRSGYRSFKTQTVLYRNIGHKGTVTKPGTSEHQTGLAVDVDVNKRLMRQTDKAYQCFDENAWLYGFILSYPPGNTYLPGPDTFEPWHWRYVGKRTALLYREAGPVGKPQEFLAALPCYEQRAMAGIWSIADEKDICLEGVNVNYSDNRQKSEKKTASISNSGHKPVVQSR